MTKWFFGFVFSRIMGWRTKGYDPGIKRSVLVVAPHTSTRDFWVGFFARGSLGLKANFLAKDDLFKGPIGWFLRKAGGFPVDRSKKTNLVQQAVEIFKNQDQFNLTITPEGTRKYAEKWKTGFYWIALEAKVPIVMIGFDFGTKTVEFKEPFMPSGDVEADVEKMKSYFRTITGAVPEYGVR